MIGDLQTAALVSTDWTVDWFCSLASTRPSVFASLLGRDKGGRSEAMKRFIPESERLHPDDWIGTNEEIDELTVFDQARALEENLPSIPMTYLASNEPLPDPKEDAAWRKLLGVSSTGSHRDG